jgi:hypothetical protein
MNQNCAASTGIPYSSDNEVTAAVCDNMEGKIIHMMSLYL